MGDGRIRMSSLRQDTSPSANHVSGQLAGPSWKQTVALTWIDVDWRIFRPFSVYPLFHKKR